MKPIIRPASVGCNIDCRYCYHRKKDQSPKRVMSIDVFEKIIFNLVENQKDLDITWHGGEPLLAGPSFFREAFSLCRKIEKDFGVPVKHSIQSNGILLSEEYIDIIKKYNASISLSLDGPEYMHNKYRVHRSGKGTFAEVMQSIELLEKNGVDYGIVVAVSQANVKYPEKLYEFFKSEGIKNYTINPVHELLVGGEELEDFSVTSEEFAAFAKRLFRVWINDDNDEISIAYFIDIIDAFLHKQSKPCILSGECKAFIVFDYDGSVYPCEDFYGKNYRYGSIINKSLHNLIRSRVAIDLFRNLERLHSECAACEWFSICRGGCPYLRKDFQEKYLLCNANKEIFNEIYKYIYSCIEV